MARARREELVDVLRQRVVMGAELHADPRAVAAAYRALSAEGLVELRARQGIYVRADAPHARRSQSPPLSTLVDMLAHASVHEKLQPENLPAPLRRAQLIVTTQAHASLAHRLATELGTHSIVISVRSDLFKAEWSP